MGRLEGKTAIITGAARGMGAAHARGFVREGARVVLTDQRADLVTALAEELGNAAFAMEHDVASWSGWQDVTREAISRFSKIDILVNNAGILGPTAPLAELDEAEYARVCAVNQHGIFLGMKAVLPSMVAEQRGSIVNVSSISGIVANYGFPNAAYVASKFAVRGLTKAAAVEYGRYNIRVNSVHPGFIYTPMMVEAAGEEGGDATSMIPLGRIGTDEEVTNLAIFLASDESSYITGAEHVIDAGMTIQ